MSQYIYNIGIAFLVKKIFNHKVNISKKLIHQSYQKNKLFKWLSSNLTKKH